MRSTSLDKNHCAHRGVAPSTLNTTNSPLDGLCAFDEFQRRNAHIFPSVPSLRWFFRTHRAELIEAGAVAEIAGRLFANAEAFAETALAIGKRVAAERNRLGS